MNRSRLFLTAALLSLGAMPASADVTWDWGGSGNLSAYGIDQDDTPANPLNDFGFAGEGKVWGRVKLIRDYGTEYGVRGQLRFQSSEAEFSNDFIRGAPDFVDEVWAYVQTAYGRFTVGLEDGAADSAGIYAPSVSELNRIDDARHYAIQDPLSTSFTAFAPNGAHLRTDLNGSGDAFKVIYYSPRLIGVQISGSYTPELTRGLNELFNSDNRRDEQSDIWEVGVSYQGSISGIDVGIYGGYVAGTNSNPTQNNTVTVRAARELDGVVANFNSTPFTADDLQEWGAGAQVAYEGLKVGGSYRSTNIAGAAGLADTSIAPPFSAGCSVIAGCVLPNAQTTVWSGGVTYETGPWRFGANYIDLSEELPTFLDSSKTLNNPRNLTQDAQGWTGQVGYEFDENVQINFGYQHYNFDGPSGVCTTVGVDACDTLEADVGFVETSISF